MTSVSECRCAGLSAYAPVGLAACRSRFEAILLEDGKATQDDGCSHFTSSVRHNRIETGKHELPFSGLIAVTGGQRASYAVSLLSMGSSEERDESRVR